MTATHEVNPPKGPFERVVERISIETAKLDKQGGHAIAEYSAAEFIAMTAGMADPVARELAGVMAEHPSAVNAAVQQLNLWGWNRWLIDFPTKDINGKLHGKMAFAVVADYQQGGRGYSLRDIQAFLEVSEQRFKRLMPHWISLQKRVTEAETKMVWHVVRQMQDDELYAA